MGRLLWWAAGVAAIAAGIGLALLRTPHTITVPPDPDASGEAPAASEPFIAPPVRAAADVPPGVAPAQWQQLQQELAGRPDELQRLAGWFRFGHALERWRAGGPDRRALAAELDAALDERLAQREIGAGEARKLKAALLEDLLPDAPSRAAALAAWESKQPGPSPAAREAAARNTEFQQRQAALVAAWRAQPAAQRDPQALERELDALRRATFPEPNRQ